MPLPSRQTGFTVHDILFFGWSVMVFTATPSREKVVVGWTKTKTAECAGICFSDRLGESWCLFGRFGFSDINVVVKWKQVFVEISTRKTRVVWDVGGCVVCLCGSVSGSCSSFLWLWCGKWWIEWRKEGVSWSIQVEVLWTFAPCTSMPW